MAYQYKPLDRSKREIRLLILNAVDKERLKCRMITTSLDLYIQKRSPVEIYTEKARQSIASEPPESFHALSYVWGDPKPVCEIEVNGQMTKISHNLSDALLSIRDNTKYRIIWADALCINQYDNQEKSWQVQQMASVFAKAVSVISWLGAHDDDSGLALDFLQDLMQRLTSVEWDTDWHHSSIGAPQAAIDLARTLKQDSEMENAIRCLASRPYWKRVWVFQELASARLNVFLCGDIESQDIKFSLYVLRLWPTNLVPGIWNFGDLLVPETCWSMLVPFFHYSDTHPRMVFQPIRLISLLGALARLEATDGRDKVYALLPVAEDRLSLDIIPDYDKNQNEVFIETACTLLREHSVSEIISYACSSKRTLGIPSWAPAWDFDSLKWSDICFYNACQKKVQSNLTLRSIPRYSLHLKLEGYAFDTIANTSESFWQHVFRKFGAVFFLSAFLLRSWLCQLESFVAPSLASEQDTVDEVMARLLVEDVIERDKVERLGTICPSDNPYINMKNNLEEWCGFQDEDVKDLRYFFEVTKSLDHYGMIFNTTRGYIGKSKQRRCEDGNIVVIIPSITIPCILRRVGETGQTVDEDERYELVDMVYVYGIMDGEFFDQNANPKLRTFTLV